MAVPNLIALNGVIASQTRKYLWSGNLDEAANDAPDAGGGEPGSHRRRNDDGG
jgi:hypothetical protein